MTRQDPRPGAIRVAGMPVDPSGRMKVDEHLRMGCATALLLGLKQPTHCWPRSVEPHYRLPDTWVLPWR